MTILLRGCLFLWLSVCAAFPVWSQEAAQLGPDAQDTGASQIDLLIDVISDDAAREELLSRLRDVGATQAEGGADTPDTLVEEAVAEPVSFGRRVAAATQGAVESVMDDLRGLAGRLGQSPSLVSGLDGLTAAIVLETFGSLFLAIVATFATFWTLRRLMKPRYRRMGDMAAGAGIVKTIGLWIASGVLDVLVVIAAVIVGYVFCTLAIGELGSIGIRQALYLNAFLVVETVKVGVRMVLSPTTRHLRLLPLDDGSAKVLSGRVNLLIGLIGYSQFLVVPIVNSQVSIAAGRAVTALIALLVLAILVWMVFANRRNVANWMTGGATAGGDSADDGDGALTFLARRWHWPVLLYLLAMFVVVLASPPNLVLRTLTTSGQVVLVLLLGIALSTVLTRFMARGISLPGAARERLPLLEHRLNRFVPRALFVVRALIIVFVLLFALDAINLVNFRDWLASDRGLALTGTLLSVALILFMGFAIWLGITSYVDYRLNPEYGAVATAREQTLLTLLRNAGTIALVVIILMFVLAEIGLNIAPLLASAGVLGLAIGFGAQKLVQDIITGLFIQFENAINVGDIVTAGGTTGTVERLTIRSVSLRDLQGVFHIVPFSSVDMVSNYMRGFAYHVADIGVAYREDVDEVKDAMLEAFGRLRDDPDMGPNVMDEIQWFGVNSFGDSSVNMRARIKCLPGQQWGVGRAYNRYVKQVFDERNIEIPFPHTTLFLGEAKDGTTQTFNLREVRARPRPGPDIDHRSTVSGAVPTQDAPVDDEPDD